MHYRETMNDTKEEKEPKSSSTFLCRFLICVIFMGVFLCLPAQIRTEIQKKITADYTEIIFDFIEEIPYNFGYEKTSIK